jgi:threonine dehydrogenase-like Zn-dependent dehydrogenase
VKAATYYGAGDIRVEDVSDPNLEADGVIIQVKACGICGSDLHPYKVGGYIEAGFVQPGLIMGHELSGDVVEVGANVSDIKKGDRVTTASILPCGECGSCQEGQFSRCSSMKVLGFQMPGAFAEYVSIPLAIVSQTIFPLPDKISYEVGATVEPLSVGVNAAKRAQPTAGDTVAILGAGMIGQCTMQAFKALGVAQVIVSETSKKRLEVARATGADIVINAAEEDSILRVREMTSGMGADIVAECAGTPITFQQAIGMVRGGLQQAFETERPDGKIMLVGVYEQPIQWAPISVINNSVRMIGCFAGAFPPAIELLRIGKVDTKPLISHEFTIENTREAFETQLNTDESLKVIIKP